MLVALATRDDRPTRRPPPRRPKTRLSPPRQAQAAAARGADRCQRQPQSDVLDEQYQPGAARGRRQPTQSIADDAVTARRRGQARGRGCERSSAGRAAALYMGAGNGDPLDSTRTDVQELGSRAKYGAAAADEDHRPDRRRCTVARRSSSRASPGRPREAEGRGRRSARRPAVADTREPARRRAGQATGAAGSEQGRHRDARGADRGAEASRPTKPRARAEFAAQAGRGGERRRPRRRRRRPRRRHEPHGVAAPAASRAAAERRRRGRGRVRARRRSASRTGTPAPAPGSFDCSGLTMMAWAQGGVSHAARLAGAVRDRSRTCRSADAAAGRPRVLRSSGPSIHHVGMYIGNGTMIEAPHTGAFVQVRDDLPARPRPLAPARSVGGPLRCGR